MPQRSRFTAFLLLTTSWFPAGASTATPPRAHRRRFQEFFRLPLWRVAISLSLAAVPAAFAQEDRSVAVDPGRGLGSPTAAVAIVEFADFQCPYCRAFHVSTFPKLQADYIDTGKVRFFYKDFPAPGHRHALPASVAAHCAGAQGRYWPMHELLYTEQARLGEELYEELAGELGLDPKAFSACRQATPARRAVAADAEAGQRLGIRGTPSFALGYLDGDRVVIKRLLVGARPFDVFAREIESLRAQAREKASSAR